jgi:hypothetical protein
MAHPLSVSSSGIRTDVTLWLTNKLEDPWSSEKISSSLSTEILQSVKLKFSLLESSIKIRLLFSFLSLRKKAISEMEKEIMDILQLGKEDEDEWVRVVANLLNSITLDRPIIPELHNMDAFVKTREDLQRARKYF